jgi:hypothetical protein
MSSQSFILSSILNKKFTHNDGKGYNLDTIFEDMVRIFRNLDIINLSKNGGRKNLITGVYFNDLEIKEIEEFHNIDFTKDFYEFLLIEGEKKHPDLSIRLSKYIFFDKKGLFSFEAKR